MDVVGKDVYEKEQEWRQALDTRIRFLVRSLQERDHQVAELKDKFNILESDFVYNLKRLKDRDAELSKYESSNRRLDELISKYKDEIDNVHIKLERLQTKYDILVKENKEQEDKFHSTLEEERNHHEETKRQFKVASEEWKIEIGHQRESAQKQIDDLQRDLEKQKAELEEQYRSAISRTKEEFSFREKEVKKELTLARGKIQQLEQKNVFLNSENTRLQNENASLQLIVHNNKSVFDVETEKIRATIKQKEQQLHEVVTTNQKYESDIKDILKIMQIGHDQWTENQVNDEAMLLSGEEASNKIKSKIRDILKLREENKLLQEQVEIKNTEINDLKATENTNDEMQNVLKQNQILREVIKDLKRRLSGTTNETREHVHAPTSNIQADVCQYSVHQCDITKKNKVIAEETNTEEFCFHKQKFETENNTNRTQCFNPNYISNLLQSLFVYQKQTLERQLNTLNEKVEILSETILQQTTEENETSRISRLEKTIVQLKERMLKDIYVKMKDRNKSMNQNLTPSDVRMMLLEEKIDRTTENIGKTVTSEKNALLQAIDKIKIELVACLMEKIKESNHRYMQNEMVDRSNKQTRFEELQHMKNEISRLESRIKNEKHKTMNNGINSLYLQSEKAELETCPLGTLDYNCHTASLCKTCEGKKRNASTQVNLPHYSNSVQNSEASVCESPTESEVEKIWRLLNEASMGSMYKVNTNIAVPSTGILMNQPTANTNKQPNFRKRSKSIIKT